MNSNREAGENISQLEFIDIVFGELNNNQQEYVTNCIKSFLQAIESLEDIYSFKESLKKYLKFSTTLAGDPNELDWNTLIDVLINDKSTTKDDIVIIILKLNELLKKFGVTLESVNLIYDVTELAMKQMPTTSK